MAEKKEPAEKTAKAKKAPAEKAAKAPAEKAVKAPAEKTAKAPAAKKAAPAPEKSEPNRVLAQYREEVVPYLMKKFGYTTVMQVPKLEKIVINTGLGDIKDNQKSMQIIENELKLITGQKPIYCKATKSVANFKVREGMNIGLKVTLRGRRMYDFFDKFVSIALPRVRDFRGVSATAFDGRGNYAVGLKEQLIFPEITYDQVEKIRGMDVCIVTTAQTDEEARELLRALGMPFKK